MVLSSVGASLAWVCEKLQQRRSRVAALQPLCSTTNSRGFTKEWTNATCRDTWGSGVNIGAQLCNALMGRREGVAIYHLDQSMRIQS